MNIPVSKQAREKSGKKMPSWSDIKKALAGYDRAALIGLISDLYVSSVQNKSFLHARFSTGPDALKPYLKIIDDTLYPDILSNKPIQIAKAKKAISDYTKAAGEPKGILELMVFFVETGTEFTVTDVQQGPRPRAIDGQGDHRRILRAVRSHRGPSQQHWLGIRRCAPRTVS